MTEFRGFWRYPPTTFSRIIYIAKNMVGGCPRNPRIEHFQFRLHRVVSLIILVASLRGLLRCKHQPRIRHAASVI
jgi:hypothetical protein